jgi:hypothetical protein
MQVRPVEGQADTYLLLEYEIEDTPELPPVYAPTSSPPTGRRGWHAKSLPAAVTPAGQSDPEVSAMAISSEPVLSDLLIVYTPGVLAAYAKSVVANGGLAADAINALTADAVGAVDKANSAYKNSAINLQLNTVGVRQVRMYARWMHGLSWFAAAYKQPLWLLLRYALVRTALASSSYYSGVWEYENTETLCSVVLSFHPP